MENGAVLITYADSFGGDIPSLHFLLKKHFAGCFSGIHLLPFYLSSGDRGFSPLHYDEVDPAFGTWDDLRALGGDYQIMADFMVNHLSRLSPYYQDYLTRGDKSPYADLFLPVEKVFPHGKPTPEEEAAIYRRQPGAPWLTVRLGTGEEKKIWCTFSSEQIDIDIKSAEGEKLFRRALERLSSAGVKMVRLDAVGYITKKRGTSCFMVEPDIWEILEKLKSIAEEFQVDLLPEMHEHYTIQLKMAQKGFPVYDFALPLLLLYAWYGKDFSPLKNWLRICPRNQFTTLDTHDGIGVVDAADLLTPEQTDFTVEKLYSRGSNVKKKYSTSEYQNLDIYQINCTYYSALGEDDDAYIMARAIQFFAPGTPQVYYVGLLAGRNDLDLVERTRQGRDINRHDYIPEEIASEVARPVVERLKQLLLLRRSSPAFSGRFELVQSPPGRLVLEWRGADETARLEADLDTSTCLISRIDGKTGRTTTFKP